MNSRPLTVTGGRGGYINIAPHSHDVITSFFRGEKFVQREGRNLYRGRGEICTEEGEKYQIQTLVQGGLVRILFWVWCPYIFIQVWGLFSVRWIKGYGEERERGEFLERVRSRSYQISLVIEFNFFVKLLLLFTVKIALL